MEEREAIKCIRDELCRFAIVTEPAKTTFGKVRALAAAPPCHHRATHRPPCETDRAALNQVRKTYTGKIGGLQDDLAICLCAGAPTTFASHALTSPLPVSQATGHHRLEVFLPGNCNRICWDDVASFH